MSVPKSSGDFEGENYEDVVDQLKDAGFTNVETETIDDLIIGVLVKDGEVEDVSIDGDTDFDTSTTFPADASVVVRYHTFPEDDGDDTESASPETKAPDEVLTVDNNADLAAILKLGDNCDPAIGEFAKQHRGDEIRFDGSVIAFGPHGSYDTRYDILIGPGDFDPNSAVGPTFQFVDVGMFDLHFTGKVPGHFGLGDNATFTAKVGSFAQNSCLFRLQPVETRVR